MMALVSPHSVILRTLVAWLSAFALLTAEAVSPAFAQDAQQQVPAKPFSQGQLEQLAAPIALYPDRLLTQVLIAATYPLDVAQAARWRKANPRLTGERLESALAERPWDESVKALTAVPDVLQMMSDRLEWTEQLGEAFLAQEDDLMAAVQDLRRRAEQAGNLASRRELRIVRGDAQRIIIEPAEPEVVYVPYYDPGVYGVWPYPDYPPYSWWSTWRRGGSGLLWFGAAVAAGTALWATWDWNRRRVAIDRDRFTRFNRTARAPETWQFDPQRRRGAAFRTPALVNQFKDANVPPVRRQGPRAPMQVAPSGKAVQGAVPGTKSPGIPLTRSGPPARTTPQPPAVQRQEARPTPRVEPRRSAPAARHAAPAPRAVPRAAPRSAPIARPPAVHHQPAVRAPVARVPAPRTPPPHAPPPRAPAVHAPPVARPAPAPHVSAPRPAAPAPRPAAPSHGGPKRH